jgi:hypothetical protein
MIRLIQRLLQLAVIGGLIYVIVKPAVLPTKFQSVGYATQRWLFGSEVSLASAQNTWRERWIWLSTYFPPLANWTTSLFSAPPAITSDGVLQWFNTIMWKQPAAKLEMIKQNLYETPASSSSSILIE